jgi:O-antigen/teichoic acid export membrane protein
VLVLRLVGILVLIAIVGSVALYLFTRNRRFLTIAWRIFQFAFIFLLVFMALYVLERLVLVI